MKKIIIISRRLMLVIIFFILISFTNTKHEQQLVSFERINIECSEDKFLNNKILLDFIKDNGFTFDSVYLNQFKLQDLEKHLNTHPFIDNAEVFANQKGEVGVDIIQREAVVRVLSDKSDYYLDIDNKVMPISEEYTSRVLVVSGDVGESNHEDILKFVNIINQDEFWKAQITQLYFEDNECILVPRIGEQKIHFGLLSEIENKLNKLYSFYQQAMPLKGWQTYSDINLKYKNQIVCTKK